MFRRKQPVAVEENVDEKQPSDEPKSTTVDEKAPSNDPPPVSFFRLFRFATKGEILLNCVGIVCAIAAGAAQPLMSLIFGRLGQSFVDFGMTLQSMAGGNPTPEQYALYQQAASNLKDETAKNALWLVCIGLGTWLTTWIHMTTWALTGERNAKRIRENYLRAILRQDIAYFDTSGGAGEVATRIQSDTHLIQMGTSEKVPFSMTFISAFVTGFILAYITSWKLSLAISSILPCIAIIGSFLGFFLSRYRTQQLNHQANSGSLAEEVIATIRTAHAFGVQRTLGVLFNNHVELGHVVEAKMAVVTGIGLAGVFFAIYGGYGLAFQFGTTLILAGEIDAGTVITVLLSIMIGSFSLAMLAPEVAAVTSAMGAAAKLFATIDRIPPIDSADPSGLAPEKVVGEVVLKDVKFNYPTRPDVEVLKGVSLVFKAGETTALVGASGCGKSTIISLIERFYDPLSGVVELDHTDVKDLNVKWLRSQIGLVSQEPVLFSMSIRDNVEMGLTGTPLEKASDEERMAAVKEACVKANADGFITSLPEGYATPVGERGFLLSGGQKQRIAIARAIASNPPILLLDEATSALDTQSEGIVQNALDKAAAGRTTIVIAHRLSTIMEAGRIYVFGEGKLLETGTHHELLRDNGAYARLVQSQKLKESTPSDSDPALVEAEGAGQDAPEVKGGIDAPHADPDTEKMISTLKRTDTAASLASAVLKDKAAARDAEAKAGEYPFFYAFGRMAQINRDAKWLYIWGCLGAAVGGMVFPVFGIIYAKAMEGFQLSGQALRVSGDRNALWFFVAAIAAAVGTAAQNYALMRAAADLTAKLRAMIFQATLRQDIAYFDDEKHGTGAVTSNLSENPQKISGLAGATLGTIVTAIVTLIGACVIGLAFAWKLSLVAIACIPTLLFTGWNMMHTVVLKDKTNKEAHEESARLACEAAAAAKTVASLTREQGFVDAYSNSLGEPLRVANRSTVVRMFWFGCTQSTVFLVNALVFWYGARLVADLEYTIFQFFVVLMSVTFGGAQAGNVFAFTPDISQSKSASEDIIRLLDAKPEIDSESSEGKALEEVTGRVELRDVHFRYPTRPTVRVLRGFNLTVEPGTHVALVGASGCGKSTVIQLIERFYNPLSGNILIDDQPVDEFPVIEYRKHIALVQQEPTLYTGTIKFNILLGAIKPVEEVTEDEIKAACRDANILDFIESLPEGFETQVGSKGSQLSGGQKQRIAIARALIRNPAVLLLDEATSALDSNSERVVQDALDRAAKGRTTISIAHRLSSIQMCDKIHFVHEGRIVESGTHEELLKSGGRYSEYVQLQDLSGRSQVPAGTPTETDG